MKERKKGRKKGKEGGRILRSEPLTKMSRKNLGYAKMQHYLKHIGQLRHSTPADERRQKSFPLGLL